MNMDTKDIIKKVMDDITPTEYPNLYSAGDVEEAIRKALEMQADKTKKRSEEDEEMINTLVSYIENPSCWNLKCPREKLVSFIKSL